METSAATGIVFYLENISSPQWTVIAIYTIYIIRQKSSKQTLDSLISSYMTIREFSLAYKKYFIWQRVLEQLSNPNSTLNNDDIIFYSLDRVVKLDFYNLYKFSFTAVAWSVYCSTTFAAMRIMYGLVRWGCMGSYKTQQNKT